MDLAMDGAALGGGDRSIFGGFRGFKASAVLGFGGCRGAIDSGFKV